MSDPTDLLADTSSTNDSATTHLDQLVGEGKQFKDVNVLAKAKADSDNFIKQLQKENREMVDKMKELEKVATTKVALTDVLNELKNRAPNENSNQPAISEDEIARLVREKFDGYTAEKTETANKVQANLALLKKFDGDVDKAKAFLASRTAELGVSAQTVSSLAKTSPAAFAELLGLTKEPTKPNTNVNIRNGSTPETEGASRNSTYYNKLLKEMGTAKFYQNKELLNQREQDIARLGDAYLN